MKASEILLKYIEEERVKIKDHVGNGNLEMARELDRVVDRFERAYRIIKADEQGE